MRKPIIFCDFDGTITENDNIIAIIKHFSPPGWETLVEETITRKRSVRDGVGALFALLPAADREEIIRFSIENARIRGGFQELLDYCRSQQIEFLVTSGGIDFFVYPLLAPFGIDPNRIYCNSADFSGEQVRITWPHPCDGQCSNDCGMCKTTIMRRYPQEDYFRILIGDSVTDYEGAKLADMVYARSHLEQQCQETGLPFAPYHDFYDVIRHLKEVHSHS
ncbi:2-hydroxy-3-keto-5-methylthiopentenyl-1-phosphate phosphatase [Paenibacillus sp. y28]|uniref:2-hydroxy-3-keto-5-methylthiopentenyl-1- phosphate phosphatase n=1 Tax=Paenibacillus sp. y28 TaxID=3129110 RepID=UPI0030194DFF